MELFREVGRKASPGDGQPGNRGRITVKGRRWNSSVKWAEKLVQGMDNREIVVGFPLRAGDGTLP